MVQRLGLYTCKKVMCFNSKATPVNNTDYSCNTKVVELNLTNYMRSISCHYLLNNLEMTHTLANQLADKTILRTMQASTGVCLV